MRRAFCGIIDACVRKFFASTISCNQLCAEPTCVTFGVVLNFAAQEKDQANLLPQKMYMKSASLHLPFEDPGSITNLTGSNSGAGSPDRARASLDWMGTTLELKLQP